MSESELMSSYSTNGLMAPTAGRAVETQAETTAAVSASCLDLLRLSLAEAEPVDFKRCLPEPVCEDGPVLPAPPVACC